MKEGTCRDNAMAKGSSLILTGRPTKGSSLMASTRDMGSTLGLQEKSTLEIG